MAPKKGQKSRTMRGKKDFTTKKTSKYHDRRGHYKKKMGRPYRKARKGMRAGGAIRSGPSSAPPALFTRGMFNGGSYPTTMQCRDGPFGNTCG